MGILMQLKLFEDLKYTNNRPKERNNSFGSIIGAFSGAFASLTSYIQSYFVPFEYPYQHNSLIKCLEEEDQPLPHLLLHVQPHPHHLPPGLHHHHNNMLQHQQQLPHHHSQRWLKLSLNNHHYSSRWQLLQEV